MTFLGSLARKYRYDRYSDWCSRFLGGHAEVRASAVAIDQWPSVSRLRKAASPALFRFKLELGLELGLGLRLGLGLGLGLRLGLVSEG